MAHGGRDRVLHPEYTWLSAANQVAGIVNPGREVGASAPGAVHLGIRNGADDRRAGDLRRLWDMHLADRVAKYRPGWFATWNDVEDDKMEALAPLYKLVRVAAIPAFDDPDRNVLILYRLDPLANPGKATRGRKRRPVWVPRSLRTPVPVERSRIPFPWKPPGSRNFVSR